MDLFKCKLTKSNICKTSSSYREPEKFSFNRVRPIKDNLIEGVTEFPMMFI